MKLILRFLKPHWKTCLLTIVLMIVDVAGALFIPTLVADMLNQGTSGASFSAVVHTGIQMAVVSVLAGVCAVWGGYTCASLRPGGQGHAGGHLRQISQTVGV